MRNNEVKDVSALSTLVNLKELYLNENPVKDISALYGLTQLKILNVEDTDVSQEQIDAFMEAVPDCEVRY